MSKTCQGYSKRVKLIITTNCQNIFIITSDLVRLLCWTHHNS